MSKVVFIAGMHRSGTSMLARILNLCGVYLGHKDNLLGSDKDNKEGYWENVQFTSINNKLLSELGGGWDYPPRVSDRWEISNQLSYIRSEATELIRQFSAYDQWGWKDPRNSLTLPFWRKLIPDIKVIVCVRNPLEVTGSLIKRNYFSPAMAFNLWFEYNQRLLSDSDPKSRIISHYDSFFYDAEAEIRRVLRFLELKVTETEIKQSTATVNLQLRHNHATFWDVAMKAPLKVTELYQKLCTQTEMSPQLLDGHSQVQRLTGDILQSEKVTEESAYVLSIRLQAAKRIISENEKIMELLMTQLHAKEKELTNIYQSKAWRVIQMIREARSRYFG